MPPCEGLAVAVVPLIGLAVAVLPLIGLAVAVLPLIGLAVAVCLRKKGLGLPCWVRLRKLEEGRSCVSVQIWKELFYFICFKFSILEFGRKF